MKHLKKVIGVLLLVAVPMLAWAAVANAQRFASTVDEGEAVHSSLYSSGKNITIKGEIFGDVFCAGQNIRVEATVHGDVLCAGMDVAIGGKVDGDIRAAGQNVSVSAEATNVSLAGSQVSLDAEAKVKQDLSVAGTSLNIKGEVGRDVVASGSTVVLNGMVGRNVRASGAVSLKSGANIAGDLTYTSNQNVTIANDASVAGKTQKTPEPQKRGYQFDLRAYLFVVFGILLVVLALSALFPRFMLRTSDHVKRSFFKTFFVGAVGVVAVGAAMVGLVFTLVGIPLAALLLLGFLLACGLSAPIAAYYIGRMVFNDKTNSLVIASVGAVILASTYFLPWLGLLFFLAGFGVGFGALLLELKKYVGSGGTQIATAEAGPTGKDSGGSKKSSKR